MAKIVQSLCPQKITITANIPKIHQFAVSPSSV